MKGKRTEEQTEELGGKVGVVMERIQDEGILANQRTGGGGIWNRVDCQRSEKKIQNTQENKRTLLIF